MVLLVFVVFGFLVYKANLQLTVVEPKVVKSKKENRALTAREAIKQVALRAEYRWKAATDLSRSFLEDLHLAQEDLDSMAETGLRLRVYKDDYQKYIWFVPVEVKGTVYLLLALGDTKEYEPIDPSEPYFLTGPGNEQLEIQLRTGDYQVIDKEGKTLREHEF